MLKLSFQWLRQSRSCNFQTLCNVEVPFGKRNAEYSVCGHWWVLDHIVLLTHDQCWPICADLWMQKVDHNVEWAVCRKGVPRNALVDFVDGKMKVTLRCDKHAHRVTTFKLSQDVPIVLQEIKSYSFYNFLLFTSLRSRTWYLKAIANSRSSRHFLSLFLTAQDITNFQSFPSLCSSVPVVESVKVSMKKTLIAVWVMFNYGFTLQNEATQFLNCLSKRSKKWRNYQTSWSVLG